MSAIAEELERVLARLKPEAAEKLETRVREAISSVSETEKELPTLEEIKQRVPDIAHLIGAWADEDPGDPEELELPPVKSW